MNAGPTAGRVYQSLRELIVNHGFRPGDRLDATFLAERLASSVTPVRDALNTLTGEGLVEARQGGGFFLPPLDEPALQDMYIWEAQILRLALKTGHLAPIEASCRRPQMSYADRLGTVLLDIATSSHNVEHARALKRLGARLHAVRTLEIHEIEDAWVNLAHLEYAREIADAPALRKLLQTYHHRCVLASARLVRAVYRAG